MPKNIFGSNDGSSSSLKSSATGNQRNIFTSVPNTHTGGSENVLKTSTGFPSIKAPNVNPDIPDIGIPKFKSEQDTQDTKNDTSSEKKQEDILKLLTTKAVEDRFKNPPTDATTAITMNIAKTQDTRSQQQKDADNIGFQSGQFDYAGTLVKNSEERVQAAGERVQAAAENVNKAFTPKNEAPKSLDGFYTPQAKDVYVPNTGEDVNRTKNVKEYNEKLKEYNEVVSDYEKTVGDYSKRVDKFNKSVEDYNASYVDNQSQEQTVADFEQRVKEAKDKYDDALERLSQYEPDTEHASLNKFMFQSLQDEVNRAYEEYSALASAQNEYSFSIAKDRSGEIYNSTDTSDESKKYMDVLSEMVFLSGATTSAWSEAQKKLFSVNSQGNVVFIGDGNNEAMTYDYIKYKVVHALRDDGYSEKDIDAVTGVCDRIKNELGNIAMQDYANLSLNTGNGLKDGINATWMALLSVASQYVGGFASLGESAKQALQLKDSYFTGLDPNTFGYAYSNLASVIRSSTTNRYDWKREDGNLDWFDILYGVGTSTLDSVLAAEMAGMVGGALGVTAESTGLLAKIPATLGGSSIGLQATASTTIDCTRKGMPAGQALTSGIVAGIFESLFESISIGNFQKMQDVGRDAIKQIATQKGFRKGMEAKLIEYLKSVVVNASEETFTEIANIAYDTFFNGEYSDYYQQKQAYLEANREALYTEYYKTNSGSTDDAEAYAERKARSETISQMVGRVLEAGGTGGLQGLIMAVFTLAGAPTSGANARRMASMVSNVDSKMADFGDLLDIGTLGFTDGSEAKEIANDIINDLANVYESFRLSDDAESEELLTVEQAKALKKFLFEHEADIDALRKAIASKEGAVPELVGTSAESATKYTQSPAETAIMNELVAKGLEMSDAQKASEVLSRVQSGDVTLTKDEIRTSLGNLLMNSTVQQAFTNITGEAIKPSGKSNTITPASVAQQFQDATRQQYVVNKSIADERAKMMAEARASNGMLVFPKARGLGKDAPTLNPNGIVYEQAPAPTLTPDTTSQAGSATQPENTRNIFTPAQSNAKAENTIAPNQTPASTTPQTPNVFSGALEPNSGSGNSARAEANPSTEEATTIPSAPKTSAGNDGNVSATANETAPALSSDASSKVSDYASEIRRVAGENGADTSEYDDFVPTIDRYGMSGAEALELAEIAQRMVDELDEDGVDTTTVQRLVNHIKAIASGEEVVSTAKPAPVETEDVEQEEASESAPTASENQSTTEEAKSTEPTLPINSQNAVPGALADDSRTLWGKTGSTITANHTRVKFTYAIVDASQLIISHDAYGKKFDNYPAELQPRDRSRFESQDQMNEIANGIEPERLEHSADASQGAPIVRADGVVVGGNGRVGGIRLGYENGSIDAYPKYLAENASSWGIDPTNMPNEPVLVRVVNQDVKNWVDLAAELNESTTQSYSATERAMADARKMGDILWQLKADDDTGNINIAENQPFFTAFAENVVPSGERAAFMSNGLLTQEGLKRVINAVFARAYGRADLSFKLSETLDSDMKNVVNALLATAPRAIKLTESIKAGTSYDLNIVEDILNAVDMYAEVKASGLTTDEWLSQIKMLSEYDSYTQHLALAIEANKGSAKRLRTLLNYMYEAIDALGDPNQVSIFGEDESNVTKDDIYARASEAYEANVGRSSGLRLGEEITNSVFKPAESSEQLAESTPRNVESGATEEQNVDGRNEESGKEKVTTRGTPTTEGTFKPNTTKGDAGKNVREGQEPSANGNETQPGLRNGDSSAERDGGGRNSGEELSEPDVGRPSTNAPDGVGNVFRKPDGEERNGSVDGRKSETDTGSRSGTSGGGQRTGENTGRRSGELSNPELDGNARRGDGTARDGNTVSTQSEESIKNPSGSSNGTASNSGEKATSKSETNKSDDQKITTTQEKTKAQGNTAEEIFENAEKTFAEYSPSIKIAGSKKHPAKLVESASMSAVQPPKVNYETSIPKSLINSGALSDAQMENIILAGNAFQTTLPNGKTQGFLIGDGTGVGKGREISGIILDSMLQGQKKAVWISYNKKLFSDAQRDWGGIGQNSDDVFLQGKLKANAKVDRDSGILFTTYSTLSKDFVPPKSNPGKKASRERYNQIANWLGPDFSGVIAFDEAHQMKNSTDENSMSNAARAAQELRNAFPKAKIVYVSATAATEVENLGYLDRLGLWGEGSDFDDKKTFVDTVKSAGTAGLEAVSRSLKARGLYNARSISYDGVEYERLPAPLSKEHRADYAEMHKAWESIKSKLDIASDIVSDGSPLGMEFVLKPAMNQLYSVQQRFFSSIIMAYKVPAMVESIKADLASGNRVVIQMVNTGEADTKKALAKANDSDDDAVSFVDVTPAQQIVNYLEKYFPIYRVTTTMRNGKWVSEYDTGYDGNLIIDEEALELRDDLINEIKKLPMPDSALDNLINQLGPENVAEVTGRENKFVYTFDSNGNVTNKTLVSKKSNLEDEIGAFQNGDKKVLIFNNAGGTGASYHADRSAKNQEHRVHYLWQPGWSADAAMQGLGRTHRSNQASAPTYKLVESDIPGEKRFLSTIASRLASLGALTKGQRDAGSGIFTDADDFGNTYVKSALANFYYSIPKETLKKMGLYDKLYDKFGFPKSFNDNAVLRDTNLFLNRVLSLPIEMQEELVAEVSSRASEYIKNAKNNGSYDIGKEDFKADKIDVLQETALKLPNGSENTKFVELVAGYKPKLLKFDELKNYSSNFLGIYKKANGDACAVYQYTTKNTDGMSETRYSIQSPIKTKRGNYGVKNFRELAIVPRAEWENTWNEAIKATPEYEEETMHMITGDLLPVWSKMPENSKVRRVITSDGTQYLGMMVTPEFVDSVLSGFGITSRVDTEDVSSAEPIKPQASKTSVTPSGKPNPFQPASKSINNTGKNQNSPRYNSTTEWAKTTRIKNATTPKITLIPEIIAKAEHDFGFNVTEGHVRGKGVLGIFEPNNNGIRIQKQDITALSHELGHGIDQRHAIVKQCMGNTKLLNELSKALSTKASGYSKLGPEGLAMEGFAEYLRRYLYNSDEAARSFPGVTDIFRKSLSGDELARVDYLANAINYYFSNVGTGENNKTQDREKAPKDFRTLGEKVVDLSDKIYQDWVDKYHSLKKIDDATDSRISRLASNSDYGNCRAFDCIKRHLSDVNGNYLGLGLLEILNQSGLFDKKLGAKVLKENYQNLNDYLMFKQAGWYIDNNLNIFANENENNHAYIDSRVAHYEKSFPDLIPIAKNLYNYIGLLGQEYLVNSGLMSQEDFDKMRDDNPYYVPMNRAFVKESKKKTGNRKLSAEALPYERRIGSDLPIVKPFENIMDLTVRMVTEGVKHKAMMELRFAAIAGSIDAGVMERIETPVEQVLIPTFPTLQKLRKDIADAKKKGTVPANVCDGLTAFLKSFPETVSGFEAQGARGDVIAMLVNGKTEYWQVNDKLLLETLTSLPTSQRNAFMRLVGALTRKKASFLTGSNVIWSVGTNMSMDVQTALLRSPDTKRVLKLSLDYVMEHYKERVKKGNSTNNRYYNEFLAMGGAQSSVFSSDKYMAKEMRRGLIAPKLIDKIKYERFNPISLFNVFLDATLLDFGESLEASRRYAIYASYRALGFDQDDSFYMAMDAMTNFKRNGSKMSQVSWAVAFLNASVQGPDSMFRWLLASDYKSANEKGSTHYGPVFPANEPTVTTLGGSSNADAEALKRYKAKQRKEIQNRKRLAESGRRIRNFVITSALVAAVKYLWNHRNKQIAENYKLLSNYTKFNYHVFMDEDGTPFTIPKAREYSVLSSLMESLLDEYVGDDPTALDGFDEYTFEHWLPKGLSNIASGVSTVIREGDFRKGASKVATMFGDITGVGEYSDLRADKDYLGRSITGSNQGQSKEYKEYYDEKTSIMAYGLGQLLNVEPKAIDYIGSNNLGWLWNTPKYVFPKGGSEYRDLTLGVKSKYSKDVAYSNDVVNWVYDRQDVTQRKAGSTKATAEDSYNFDVVSMYSSIWSNYTKATSSSKTSKADARESRLEVLDLLTEYQYKTAKEEMTDEEQFVHDIYVEYENSYSGDSKKKLSFLPKAMSNEISEDNKFTDNPQRIKLSGQQYINYQKDYLDTYWHAVAAIRSNDDLSFEEKVKQLALAEDVASNYAKNRALQASGATYDSRLIERCDNYVITDARMLKSTYLDADVEIVQAIIDLNNDREGNDYRFAPSPPDAPSYADASRKGYVYVLDDEWKQKREEKYYELYNEYLGEALASKKYEKAKSDEEKEKILREARDKVSDDVRTWLLKEMRKAGVKSTKK